MAALKIVDLISHHLGAYQKDIIILAFWLFLCVRIEIDSC